MYTAWYISRGWVTVYTVHIDSKEIYSELIFQFPKLFQAGEFELLHVSEDSGKVFASPKNGYTVRAVVHHAVIYIRPMQQIKNQIL